MSYSLEIKELTKKYDNFLLDHISFQINTGSIMGFIGENGAGKSTTLKSILNIIKKDAGTVRMLGMNPDIEQEERIIKDQLGVVPDECHFHDTLTVKAINHFMSRLYSAWDSKLYYHYVEEFRLPKNTIIKEYSRGMKMKLSIAAALSHHPRLLLMDEATSGLDPVVRNEILDVFFDYIQDENHSILMSSHITSDLEKICDYITFIHKGRIILSGGKDDMIYSHAIFKCSKPDFQRIDKADIIGIRSSSFGYEMLVNRKELMKNKYPFCTVDSATLEDIMLFYTKGDKN